MVRYGAIDNFYIFISQELYEYIYPKDLYLNRIEPNKIHKGEKVIKKEDKIKVLIHIFLNKVLDDAFKEVYEVLLNNYLFEFDDV